MENQSYYRSGYLAENGADYCDSGVPLAVNCAGYVSISRVFVTSGIRHDYYLQLMDVGELSCGTDGNKYVFGSGEFIIHPPEIPYRYELTEDRGMGYYWAHFTGNCAEKLLESAGLETGRVYRLNGGIPPSVRRTFGEIFGEFMLCGRGYEEFCAAKLTEIIVELGRAVSSDGYIKGKRFAGLMEYIHSHYTEELCVADLAESEHLSVSRFRDLFRRNFGCSPSEYIIGLRLRHAKNLLTDTDLTITEIAGMCGYSDNMYFMRLFRKKTGMSAREYRRYKSGSGE